MKKFITKISLFTTVWLGLIIIFLVYGKMLYCHKEYPMWKSKIEIMDSEFKYDSVILGDSRSLAGIIPDILGDSFYNLSVGGGTPIEGLFALKRLVSQQKIKLLIISYSPFHFEFSGAFFERALAFDYFDTKQLNEIFFSLNKDKEIFWDKESQKSKFVLYLGMLKGYLIKFKLHPLFRSNIKKLLFNPTRIEENNIIYNEISKTRGYHSFGTRRFSDGLNFEANYYEFKIKKIMILSLYKILDIAENNNISVIFNSMPMNVSSFNNLKPRYVNGYNTFFEKIEKKYPTVTFDYQLYPYDNSFFGDNSHLNIKGASRYSRELSKKLQILNK
jgi:hypothetical protein